MSEIPEDVIEAGNRFADLFGDGRQGYAAFDIAVLAIMEERERDQWQPIETAPKDGTYVDLWAVRGECGELGYRDGERYPNCCFARRSYGTEPFGDPVWIGLNDRYIKVTPTHWQPLPAAPKGE